MSTFCTYVESCIKLSYFLTQNKQIDIYNYGKNLKNKIFKMLLNSLKLAKYFENCIMNSKCLFDANFKLLYLLWQTIFELQINRKIYIEPFIKILGKHL